MDGTLIVSKEEMQAAASELSGYVSQMESSFELMQRTMERTSGYWTGDAGDAHRQLYLDQIENTRQIIARYQEHVQDLNAMAGVYETHVRTVASMIDEIPVLDL